ncbi:MAG: protein-L-isoaspartate O-methyltransferase [Gammaproteobacteria bacterium]|nr:protein-L-isoaspartate O-methyltransferase [Gammaproteobacteria bacterium]
MNFEQARFNMVEQQVRTWMVLDPRVLESLSSVPREAFVPAGLQNLAFTDTALPLEHGQFMMPPREEGRLVQALSLKNTDTVLEVGTGSGYVTALLAKLAKHVYSVDIYPDFVTRAGEALVKNGINNVTLEVADAATGWDHHAPYDAIAITGSLETLPEAFKQAMKIGGRLFCVLGDAPAMRATLVTRTGQNEWQEETLFETVVPRLVNAPQSSGFRF